MVRAKLVVLVLFLSLPLAVTSSIATQTGGTGLGNQYSYFGATDYDLPIPDRIVQTDATVYHTFNWDGLELPTSGMTGTCFVIRAYVEDGDGDLVTETIFDHCDTDEYPGGPPSGEGGSTQLGRLNKGNYFSYLTVNGTVAERDRILVVPTGFTTDTQLAVMNGFSVSYKTAGWVLGMIIIVALTGGMASIAIPMAPIGAVMGLGGAWAFGWVPTWVIIVVALVAVAVIVLWRRG